MEQSNYSAENKLADDYGTVGRSPTELLQYELIEIRRKARYHLHNYIDRKSKTEQEPNNHAFHSAVVSFFIDLEPHLENWLKENEYGELLKDVMDEKHAANFRAYRCINHWLYVKKLIRLDNMQDYDSTSGESENNAKGI